MNHNFNDLKYKKLNNKDDLDIPYLLQIYLSPEISRFISIDEKNYFSYVTHTPDVYFFKVYARTELVGAIHLEVQKKTLFMDIMIIPKYQRRGIGTAIIKDLQNNAFEIDYEHIEVAIDQANIPSRKLFEKMGFQPLSKEDELINYIYAK